MNINFAQNIMHVALREVRKYHAGACPHGACCHKEFTSSEGFDYTLLPDYSE